VDAFNYGKIPDCDGYFLTHFHSDHYGGLRTRWSHGPIYCSQITANLVRQELRVDSRFVHPLPMNELYPIPGSNVTVALIDANHCPGSVLFLFIVERPNKTVVRHLHTGDFRAAPRMCLHPLLRQPDNPPIQCLYLDTTYLNPQYAFPAQEECIQAVCDTVQKEIMEQSKKKENTLSKWFTCKTQVDKRMLIVVGAYTVGKERVFINVAKMLKCKIYANEKKAKILHCLEDEELRSMLTEDPKEAQVHVVSLRDIRADMMANYLWDLRTHFDSLLAFKPTGWTYKSTASETVDMNFAALSQVIMPPSNRILSLSPNYESTNIKIYAVPYSEHSSFRELASFIASLDIQQIIPTVNISQKDKLFYFIDKWQQEKTTKRIEVVAYPNENYW
ncbi:DRMBL-domain-containing protein, partial [Rhizopus microsporus ATCC 52813]